MLSRRNIRIKVMQVLYARSRDKELSHRQALMQYHDSIRHAFELYLLSLLQLIKVAEYAEQDYSNKRSKLRPSEEDKAFKPKLGKNGLIRSLQENRGLQDLFRIHKTPDRIKEDNTRLLYNEYAKTAQYDGYARSEDDSDAAHLGALLELNKSLNGSELFNEVMDDNYITWQDDKSLVVGAMKKTIKALPVSGAFYQEFQPDDETVIEFGETLLQQVEEKEEYLKTLIEPTLKNWDAERVAVLDMILLKMAVCELMNFNTIPTKVTLNEYVEISKLYSTDKSKDFINGILDRLLKKLETEGKIVKEGRGLLEE
jgi:N utilization substance protein B